MKSMAAGALVAMTLLAGCGAQGPAARTAAAIAPHATARAGGFTDLSGNPVSIGSLSGHPVVLAFLSPSNWDSGAEVPLLIRLAGGYQPDVAFVAAGENASLSDLQTFSDNNQLNFPVWADPGGSELARRHFSAVPAFQFLDRGGRVVSSHQGFMAKGELLSAIAQITQ